MFKTFAKTALVSLLLAGGVAQAATTTYVDLFSTAQNVGPDAAGGTASDQSRVTDSSLPSSILGNDREIYVTATGDGVARARAGYSTTYLTNVLSLSNEAGTSGAYKIIWDGDTGVDNLSSTTVDYSGLLTSFDLTDSFVYHVYKVDLGTSSFYFGITLYDTDGDSVTLEIDGTATHVGSDVSITLDTILNNLASVYDYSGNGTFDLTNVGAIVLTVNSEVDVDMTIGAIKTTVPEPAGLALVGTALAGLGLASRRRRSGR